MPKINDIQQKILQLDGGKYELLMDEYLYRRYGLDNITPLGLQTGSSKTTKGTPDSYIKELINGQYIFIMSGTQINSFKKIKEDIQSCLNPDKTGIAINKIEKIYCCHTSTNIKPGQHEELCSLFANIELVGIGTVAYDLLYKYQALAKDLLDISIDTGQILSIEEFIKKNDYYSYATPLDKELLYRDKEIKETIELLKQGNALLIFGKSGTGKTKFALELINHYAEKNNAIIKCVKQNGEPIYEDLKAHFPDDNNYIVLIDDANQLAQLELFAELCVDKSRSHKTTLILTVRDYAKESVLKKMIKRLFPLEYELKPLNKQDITEIIKKNWCINNVIYLDRIIGIANGNIRLAIMAVKCAMDKNMDDIKNASNIYDYYFNDIIFKLDKNTIIIAALIVFFDKINLNNIEHPAFKIAHIIKISQNEFKEKCIFLHVNEIVDMYEDSAVKFGEQSFGDYLLYIVFYKNKYLSINNIIYSLFPSCLQRIIYTINTLLKLFNNEEIFEYIKIEIKNAWYEIKNNNHTYIKQFLLAFHVFLEDETLLFIKQEITMLPIQDRKLEFFNNIEDHDLIRNHNIKNISIDILCNFKHSQKLTEAIDLLLLYFGKDNSNLMDYYACFYKLSNIDQYSNIDKYSQQKILVDKLYAAYMESKKTELAMLLLCTASNLLNFKFETAFADGSKRVSFRTYYYDCSEESFALRTKCINILCELFNVDICKNTIYKILFSYKTYDLPDGSIELIKNDINSFANFATKKFSYKKYCDCQALLNFEKVCNDNKIKPPKIFSSYKKNTTFSLFLMIADTPFKRGCNYEKEEKLKAANIKEVAPILSEKELISFFNMLKKSGDTNKNNWDIQQGLSMFFDALHTDTTKYLNTLTIFLKSEITIYSTNLAQSQMPWIASNFDYAEFESFISKIKFSSKSIWLSCHQDKMPIEIIQERQGKDLLDYLETYKYDPFISSVSIRTVVNIDIYSKGFARKYLAILMELPEKKREYIIRYFLLSACFDEELSGQEIVYLFKEGSDSKLLQDAYITALSLKEMFDYNKKLFFALLDDDHHNFIPKIISFVLNKNTAHSDNGLLFSMWSLPNYENIINDTVELLFNPAKEYYSVENLLCDLFHVGMLYNEHSDRLSEDIIKKQDKWLIDYITINIDILPIIEEILKFFNNFPDTRRKKFILFLCKINQDFSLFKKVELLPLSSCGWGSEVPTIEENISFLNCLKNNLHGIDFIEHRLFLSEKIDKLEKYKNKVLLRDFWED